MAAAIAFPGVNMFEAVSDDIDEVNVLKTSNKEELDIYQQSEFDKGKDTTTFRRFDDACVSLLYALCVVSLAN